MSDVVFRSQVQSGDSNPPPVDKADVGPRTAPETKIEVPYTDYVNEYHRPFIVDYYQLGNSWEDPDGGFYREVNNIENYLRNQIEKGELANTLIAVKEKMKKLEKINGLDKTAGTNLKISVVSAFVKFLQETRDVKNALRKYGHN